MGPARRNPSAGYSFSFYAVTVLSSFSDCACSGLQTGNPDMAIHQCCYNLSDFISFWILSPKWKGRGGKENSAVWFFYTYEFSIQWIQKLQKFKSEKVPGTSLPATSLLPPSPIPYPPTPILFLRGWSLFLLFLLQQIHEVYCSGGFWLIDSFPLF